VSYVSIVFDAHVLGGEARADGEETTEVRWCTAAELSELALTDFTVALFEWWRSALRPPSDLRTYSGLAPSEPSAAVAT